MDYDLANTWFGNADAMVRYTAPWITVTGGLRQYRPHFDLWTIWGAFSPGAVPRGECCACGSPDPRAGAAGRWERYAYSDTETETPLVDVDNDGWRLGVGATYSPARAGRFDAGYREEYGPGASSHGFEGVVTWLPTTVLSINAYGSTLDRPLEFRFNEASVDVLGVDAEWSAGSRLRLAIGAARYWGKPGSAGCRRVRLGPDPAARQGDTAAPERDRRVPTPARAANPSSGGKPVRLRSRWVLLARHRCARQRHRPGRGGAAALRPLAASRALPSCVGCHAGRRGPAGRSGPRRRTAPSATTAPSRRRWTGRPPAGPTRQQPSSSPTRPRRGVRRAAAGFHPPVRRLPHRARRRPDAGAAAVVRSCLDCHGSGPRTWKRPTARASPATCRWCGPSA